MLLALLTLGQVLRETQVDGVPYRLLADGAVQRKVGADWQELERVFDPDTIRRSYVVQSQKRSRVDLDSGARYGVIDDFREAFEALPTQEAGLQALIGPRRGWSEFTLQTPDTPLVADYVRLRAELLAGRQRFGPARIEAQGGALRFTTPACPPDMVCTKSSLTTGLIFVRDGEEFEFSARFWLAGPRPLTLADVENDLIKEYPGLRLRFFGEHLGVEMKALDRPAYRQTTTPFPTRQWVNVRWRVKLHPSEGRVRIWQDQRLTLDQKGPTSLYTGAFLNSLEVGITAHTANQPTEIRIDDVRFRRLPLLKQTAARNTQ